MRIRNIEIGNFRAFQQPTKISLAQNVTVLTGLNGLGKSTVLALLANAAFLPNNAGVKPYLQDAFTADLGEVLQYDNISEPLDEQSPDEKPFAIVGFSDNVAYLKGSLTPTTKIKYTATSTPRPLRRVAHDPYTWHESFSEFVDPKKSEEFANLTLPDLFTKRRYTKEVPRFRFIPTWYDESGAQRRSKVHWPTLYVGLSRVFPAGENIETTPKQITPDIYTDEMVKQHIRILGEKITPGNIFPTSVTGTNSSKVGVGFETDEYGALSNSSGQDNLSQLLLAVQSFARLKDVMGENYDGGLLTIDEIDATLHPAAQNLLIDYLVKQSQELDLQIVVTTHSLSLIEHFEKYVDSSGNNKIIELERVSPYAENSGEIEVVDNPVISRYKNVLFQRMGELGPTTPKVKVFTEDDITRYFMRKIVEKFTDTSMNKYVRDLNFLETSMGYSSLFILFDSDPDYYQNSLAIVDPDVTKSDLARFAPSLINTMKFNDKNGNIFSIPGTKSIESSLIDYIIDNPDSPVWNSAIFRNNNITYDLMTQDINDNQIYKGPNKRGNISFQPKKWYEIKRREADVITDYYLESNADEFSNWLSHVNHAAERLLKNNQK